MRPRGPLVLVIEDNDAMRDLYAAELASAGFMVLEADSGAAGVEKALQFGPHAIVLNLVLSGIDGFKVTRRLRTDDRTRDIAIVAVSDLVSTKSKDLAIAAGCDSFFVKPVIPAELVSEVVRLVSRPTRDASMPDISRLMRGH